MRLLTNLSRFQHRSTFLSISRDSGIVNTPLKNISSISSPLKAICFFGMLGLSTQATALNRIQIENALPGTTAWYEFYVLGTEPTDNIHDMEGYADKDSVNIGQAIKFYVNSNPTKDPQYKITIYRLGWYGGTGGRQVVAPILRSSIQQTLPTPNPITGLTQANWTSPYSFTIPTTWTSGLYVATITGNWTGKGQYIPFVVRDKARSSDYLFQTSTTTWQAYNAWGGKSLYGYNSNGIARKVSFNRPYDSGGGLAALLEWDVNMAYFMESNGYDVTYQSDVDTHVDNGLLNHKAVLSVGHDEYWTKAMRDNFENAQKQGISLGFFGANIAYWQIRMENAVAPLAAQANRTIVAYKDFAPTEDPLAIDGIVSNNNLVTSRWRDPSWANRPENALIGVMYAFGPKGNGDLNTDIVLSKNDPWQGLDPLSSHWVYTGTGLTIGSPLSTFSGLLGYEADRVFDNGYTPAGLEIVAASPVPLGVVDHESLPSTNYDPTNPKSHVTVYTKACTVLPCQNANSTVFAVGSLQWVWGLNSDFKYTPVDPQNYYSRETTRNALARMISAPFPAEVPTIAAANTARFIDSPLATNDDVISYKKKNNPLMNLIRNEHARKQKVKNHDVENENNGNEKNNCNKNRNGNGNGNGDNPNGNNNCNN